MSLSADGNTAIIGGYFDNDGAGAAWVWTRSAGVWTQQGTKLVGSGALGPAEQGSTVSLSADGNTAIVGGWQDNGNAGAAWVWTRSGGVWAQQGSKLVGSGAVGNAEQGYSVSVSADGNTAIVGGGYDNNGAGAAWVWTRSAGVWTQQGSKLVGSGAVGTPWQSTSVSLSSDGNTAIVGGFADNSFVGAAWVWTRSAGVWTQQGTKLVGSGATGNAWQGWSVSLSGDGNTAIVGGGGDNYGAGAAWVWTRSAGVWTQQGTKLVGSGALGPAEQGPSVSLSADGNTAIVGGPADNSYAGAAWVWTRSAGVWTQQGSKLVGSGAVGNASQGAFVSLSADGNTAIVGGYGDNSDAGAAWVFALPVQPVGLVEDAHATGGTISNVNTVLEPGETVLVNPSWKNISAAPLALTGTASAFTGPTGATYTLIDTAASYGTIAPGATADSFSVGGPSYRLFVSNPVTRPAAHWDATFLETLSDGIAKTWTLHIGQSFTDVPVGDGAYRFAETLLHNNISSGCGSGNYCPASDITRWQMAVFLATSMVGPSGTVPSTGTVPSVGTYDCSPGGNSLFADVPPTDGGCRFIHYIYAQGITGGCGGGNYCPSSNVTRWQMAVFLATGMVGPSGTVPTSGTVPSVGTYNCSPGGNSLFADVPPTDAGCRFIHYLYANGVTSGCGGGNYCPASNVTRWQMAVFLVTAFKIALLY